MLWAICHGKEGLGHVYGNVAALRAPAHPHDAPPDDPLLPSALGEAIYASWARAKVCIKDIDLVVRCHDAFGKGAIKKMKISPDACIQLALQVPGQCTGGLGAAAACM